MSANWSAASRKAAGERVKARHADPVFRAKISAGRDAHNADPEVKAKKRARMKALHADPVFKAKLEAWRPPLNLSADERRIYAKLKAAGLDREAAVAQLRALRRK